MDTKSNTAPTPNDDAVGETQAQEAVYAAAKALKKGDRTGAKAVLGEAILAQMDPFTIGGLHFRDIKTSTGIPVGEISKQYDTMAGARKTGLGKAERVPPFAVYKRRGSLAHSPTCWTRWPNCSAHECRALKMT
jgi:hypothetical protein